MPDPRGERAMYDTNYVRIMDSLRQKIKDGTYKSEQKLPELDDLAQEYGATVSSVRQAVDILEKEGLLIQKQVPAFFISSLKKDRILVVEDNPVTRELLEDIVFSSGYMVKTAKDGHEAVNLIEAQKFNLVFLDLRLPGISGIEILKKIKEVAPGVPVVVIAGYPEDLLSAKKGAIWPEMVISKPFKISQIKEALTLIKNKD